MAKLMITNYQYQCDSFYGHLPIYRYVGLIVGATKSQC